MDGTSQDHPLASQQKPRTDTSSPAATAGRRGRASPRYGSHRTLTSNGYVRVWLPDHPMANKDGYALEHRVVLYDAGIAVERGMHVDHRNGDKTDNHLENLRVLTPKQHV